eukprot:scaffold271_cov252-Pinguiococcus_pyrenoidosus.AAC.14
MARSCCRSQKRFIVGLVKLRSARRGVLCAHCCVVLQIRVVNGLAGVHALLVLGVPLDARGPQQPLDGIA